MISGGAAFLIVEKDTQPEANVQWVEVSSAVKVGDWYANGTWSAPKVTSVTPRQARLALLAAGKLDQVTAAIAAMPGQQKTQTQISWDYAGEIRRSDPIVTALATALSLSAADVDALFAAASVL